MITAVQCLKRFGAPQLENDMTIISPPKFIRALPRRIYCNEEIAGPLKMAFDHIIGEKIEDEIETWDGCFNIRRKVGNSSMSLHSWGLAIDINAAWNRDGKQPTMSKELVECFKDAGFDWGGDWSVPDGMHFQLREFKK